MYIYTDEYVYGLTNINTYTYWGHIDFQMSNFHVSALMY